MNTTRTGRATRSAGTRDSDFGYTGHWQDRVAGLSLPKFRAYDADRGRWLSADPLGPQGSKSPNLYHYGKNDPINHVDPDGAVAWVAAGAVIGAAVSVGALAISNGGFQGLSAQQIAAAAAGGALAGALGAVAGPLGGTMASSVGFSSTGWAAQGAAVGLSAAAGFVGQDLTNMIDPCNRSSLANASLWGAGGQVASNRFAAVTGIRGMATMAQAEWFAPRTLMGLLGSRNAAAIAASALISGAIGAGAGTGKPFSQPCKPKNCS